jgi:hypothetical protein
MKKMIGADSEFDGEGVRDIAVHTLISINWIRIIKTSSKRKQSIYDFEILVFCGRPISILPK